MLGWWALPWGPIVTPVIVIRNLMGLLEDKDTLEPTEQLEKMARIAMIAQDRATELSTVRSGM